MTRPKVTQIRKVETAVFMRMKSPDFFYLDFDFTPTLKHDEFEGSKEFHEFIDEMLRELFQLGVNPGARLKVTFEEMPEEEK